MRTRHAIACVGMLVASLVYAEAQAEEHAEDDAGAYRLQIPADQYRVQPNADWQLPSPRNHNPVTEARPFATAIATAAQRAGIDPELLHAVVKAESNYQAGAQSPKGATGLTQLMPETASRYGTGALNDSRRNLQVGARHLRHLLDRFNQNLELALAAYNAGPGVVDRFGGIPPYRETRDYVIRVLGEYEALKASRRTIPQPWQLNGTRGS